MDEQGLSQPERLCLVPSAPARKGCKPGPVAEDAPRLRRRLPGLRQWALPRAVWRLFQKACHPVLRQTRLLRSARAGPGRRDRPGRALLHESRHAIQRTRYRWPARAAGAGAGLHRATAAGVAEGRASARPVLGVPSAVPLPDGHAAGAVGLVVQPAGTRLAVAVPRTGVGCFQQWDGSSLEPDHGGEHCGRYVVARRPCAAVVDHVLVALVRSARKTLDTARRMAAGCTPYPAPVLRAVAASGL